LFKNEEKYLVDPNYMSNQSDINHRMRAILIDWLIDVHLKYKLIPQTMYIAVNLIDRYLEKNETKRTKLQLVGVTAMFIACKYEEIYPPELKDFVYITDGAYVKADVLNMEYKMLKSLDFNVTFPTQWSIFEIYKKKLDLNEKTFKLAWFLMELCLINYKTLKYKMSVLAASAILIASKTLGVYSSNWFLKNVGIEEKNLEECCKEMYDFYVYNSTHSLQAIRKKFSSSKKVQMIDDDKIQNAVNLSDKNITLLAYTLYGVFQSAYIFGISEESFKKLINKEINKFPEKYKEQIQKIVSETFEDWKRKQQI